MYSEDIKKYIKNKKKLITGKEERAWMKIELH